MQIKSNLRKEYTKKYGNGSKFHEDKSAQGY